jgi:hypothetical protein
MLEEVSPKTMVQLEKMDVPQLRNIIKQNMEIAANKGVEKEKQKQAEELARAANQARLNKLENGKEPDSYGADELSGKSLERMKQYMGKLVDLPLQSFVPKLAQAIQNPKVQKFLMMAKADGKSDDDKISVQEGEVDVSSLIPTQNEVFLEKSLAWPFSKQPDNIIKVITNGNAPGMPSIVVSGNYIIDGHHRWSQIYCLNKNGKIPTYNITFEGNADPTQILKKIHLGIAATTGDVPLTGGESKDTNLFTVGYDAFKSWVGGNLNEKSIQAFKTVEDIMKSRIGSKKDTKTEIANNSEDPFVKDIIVPYLWSNVESIKTHRGEYPRAIMPQTEKNTEIGSFVNTMKSGNVNVDVKTENKIFESTFNKFKNLYTK